MGPAFFFLPYRLNSTTWSGRMRAVPRVPCGPNAIKVSMPVQLDVCHWIQIIRWSICVQSQWFLLNGVLSSVRHVSNSRCPMWANAVKLCAAPCVPCEQNALQLVRCLQEPNGITLFRCVRVRPVPCEFYSVWPDSKEWLHKGGVTPPRRLALDIALGNQLDADDLPLIAAHREYRNEKRQRTPHLNAKCLVQFAEQRMGCETYSNRGIHVW